MVRRVRLLTYACWLVAIATALLAAGCTATPGPPPTLRVPTLRVPTVGPLPGLTPLAPTAQAPRSPSTNLRARYQLTLAQAIGYAAGGYPVAGTYDGTREVRVQKATITEWEEKPTTEQVCKDRWDPVTGKDKWTCRYETVQKRQPVQKVVFYVSGDGMTTARYPSVNQAFARIAATDFWRLANAG